MCQEENKGRWNYSVIAEMGFCEEVGRYETYGIEVIGPNLQHTVHDVSVYQEVVSRLSELFNHFQLSPIHMEEVIADQIP